MVLTRAQRGTKADDNGPPTNDAPSMLKAPPKRAGRKKAAPVEEPPAPAPKSRATKPAAKSAAKPAMEPIAKPPVKPVGRPSARATTTRRNAAAVEDVEVPEEAPKAPTRRVTKPAAKPAVKPATTRRTAVQEEPAPEPEPVVEDPVEEPVQEPAEEAKPVSSRAKRVPVAPKKPATRGRPPKKAAQTEETEEPIVEEPKPAPARRTRGRPVADDFKPKNKPVEKPAPAKEPLKATTSRKRKAEEDTPEVEQEKPEKAPEPATTRTATRGRGASKKSRVEESVPEVPKKATRGRKPAPKPPVKPVPTTRTRATKSAKKVDDVEMDDVSDIKEVIAVSPKKDDVSVEPTSASVASDVPAEKETIAVSPKKDDVPAERTSGSVAADVAAEKETIAVSPKKDSTPLGPIHDVSMPRSPTASNSELQEFPEPSPAKPEKVSITIVTSGAAAAKQTVNETSEERIASVPPVGELSLPASELVETTFEAASEPSPAKVSIGIVTSGLAATKHAARVSPEATVAPMEPTNEAAVPKSPEPSKIPVATPARSPIKPENLSIPHVEDPFAIQPSPLKAPPMKIPNLSPDKPINPEVRNPTVPITGATPMKTSSLFQQGTPANMASSLLGASARKAPVASPLKQPPIHASPFKFGGGEQSSFAPVVPEGSFLHGSARKPPSASLSLPGSAVKATSQLFDGKSSLLKSCPRKIQFSLPKPDTTPSGSSLFGGSRLTSSFLKVSPLKLKSPAKFPKLTPAKSSFMSPVPEDAPTPQMGALEFLTMKALTPSAKAFAEPVVEENNVPEPHVSETHQDEDEDVSMVDVFEDTPEIVEEPHSVHEKKYLSVIEEVEQEVMGEVDESHPVNEEADLSMNEDASQHSIQETMEEFHQEIVGELEEFQAAHEDLSAVEEFSQHSIQENVEVATESHVVHEVESPSIVNQAAQEVFEQAVQEVQDVSLTVMSFPQGSSSKDTQSGINPACLHVLPNADAQVESVAASTPGTPQRKDADNYVSSTESPEEKVTERSPLSKISVLDEEQIQIELCKTPLKEKERIQFEPCKTPTRASLFQKAFSLLPTTIASPIKSSLRSPEKRLDPKTPKKTVTWQTTPQAKSPELFLAKDGPLTGTVVFVDVKSEGKDMANLFVPLLEDLGAQTVPNWTSNSLGITHVLFKDGSRVTLDKVIASNGTVKCVNIGWAMDCEKEKKYLDESNYLVDVRAVSGTPKALSTMSSNGSPTRTPVRTPIRPTRTPLKFDFMTPAAKSEQKFAPATPVDQSVLSIETEDKENVAPATEAPNTPFFLHPKELVQRTCPTKQQKKTVFDYSGPQTPFRQRLLSAKRRSSEFQLTTSSPAKKMRFS